MKKIIVFALAANLFAFLFSVEYPKTFKSSTADTIFEIEVKDEYRWLENADDSSVINWCSLQQSLTDSFLDNLEQKSSLEKRFTELWRTDEEGMNKTLLESERVYYWVKKSNLEKYYWVTKENKESEEKILIDPNKMELNSDIEGVSMSADGEYFAYGVAQNGDEDARIRILDVRNDTLLKDTLKGRFQSVNSWFKDNDGFFYSANPRAGEEGYIDSNYYQSVYMHKLGDSAQNDRKIFFSDTLKEAFHYVQTSGNKKYAIFIRWYQNANEIYVSDIDSIDKRIPVATGFDANYIVENIGDTLIIQTDKDAPMGMAYFAERKNPERKNWKLFIKEDKNAKLKYISAAGGKIFAVYEKDAMTEIRMYDSNMKFERTVSLPEKGSADIYGYWQKDEIYLWFSSFFFPSVTYRYFPKNDSLAVVKKSNVNVNTDDYKVEQIFYKSKDKTKVPMFILSRKDIKLDKNNPVMLTGYGGFSVSMNPYFNTLYVAWLEHGGVVAVPCIRGGGEYGEEWHRKGMKENKQNVFDDFIYAAEWLIKNKYTNPDKLAIEGGSNGGLLVGAVMVQRPDLFRAVLCSVPLLDMIRYHKFGYANIWADEYGSSETKHEFDYLLKYSPYHNIRKNEKYPNALFVASENDARVDPLHAKKMVAALQQNGNKENFILLDLLKSAGHGGGVGITVQIKEYSRHYAFLMHFLDME